MEVTAEPTSTILTFVCRKSGMTFDDFKSYYENNHAPLVLGLIFKDDDRPFSYTRHYIEREASGDKPAASFPIGGSEGWDYDCMARTVFQSKEHRDSILANFGEHRAVIAADEEKFLDTSKLKIIFVTEAIATTRK